MQTFTAQLNHLLMSASEDSWLAGLCAVLESHTGAWVRITGRGGRVLAEILPSNGALPEGDAFTLERTVTAGSSTLGQLILTRRGNHFSMEEEHIVDISLGILAILLRQQEHQLQNQRKQRVAAVREAINALSFSELEAAIHISQAISGLEGRLIAGHVADKLGFARSIVVSALKKLEGAGIIESRSLGVKGTYIKIREPLLVEELSKLGDARA